MHAWSLRTLACPRCAGALRTSKVEGTHALAICRACEARYPIFAGVPVLVPEPHRYCASFRDAILASLAEEGAADTAAIALVDAFARAGGAADPARFGDDWVAHELREAPLPEVAGGPHEARWRAFVEAARADSPLEALVELCPTKGVTVEVGAGAGHLTRALASGGRKVLALDLSLRAAFAARRGEPERVASVVADADALPLAEGRAGAVVAAHLVDLLDAPPAFFAGARRALAKDGALVLSTPDPSLGVPDGDDEVLTAVLAQEGLRVRARRDGVPWLREHGPRHVEVYFAHIVAATPH